MFNDYSDPQSKLPLGQAVPLGIQHVLAMFASNLAPAFIIAGAAGIGAQTGYLIQMAMFFSGLTTLFQTIGVVFIGARLPIMMGTSFAFVPVMLAIVKSGGGMPALTGAIIISGLVQASLGLIIGKIRHVLPPLITGLVILSIGLSLLPVGIDYAAGGVPLKGTEAFGSLTNWSLALIVIVVTLAVKFMTRGFLQMAAVLIGLCAGYIAAVAMGVVNFSRIAEKPLIALPDPLHFGISFEFGAILAMIMIGFVSAIETVGDTSGITKGGAGREATDKELSGATWADGLGSALGGFFGALPNTSFSQNVGLIAMTKVMSCFVVSIGALLLLVAGLFPHIGAALATLPPAVLGGGVIVMFGMIVSTGISMLSGVVMNRRNMLIIAVALSLGLGLQAVPEALQHVQGTIGILLKSGLIPVVVISILLDRLLPEEI